MPGYKVVQQNGEIREELKCSYCKLVLKVPVQTTETGLRLCRECFAEATKNNTIGLDPNDKVWPDLAVKKEIANLKVKCNNCTAGCEWKGLFKQLEQHLQDCKHVIVVCECGHGVLLNEMNLHLHKKCPQRPVICKSCHELMCFNELQNHSEMCSKGVRKCRNCGKELLACQVIDHATSACKYIRCVCGEGGTFEVNDQNFIDHLQDVNKVGEHLRPMIFEHSKMAKILQEVLQNMRTFVKKNEVLERNHKQACERIEYLEKKTTEDEIGKQKLKERVEALERENGRLGLLLERNRDHFLQHIEQLSEKSGELSDELKKLKTEIDGNHAQMAAQLDGINMAVASSSKAELVDNPSADLIKRVEDKVLELETILNAVGGARNSDASRILKLELLLEKIREK